MERCSKLVWLALLIPALGAAELRAGELKVYISADMEGVAGVVTEDQLGPSGFEYERFRELMTREVLAVIWAARECGATSFVVSDAHGNGENLLIDLFPPDVRVVRGGPRRLSMMAGIDSTFAAAILIGYHASTTSPRGTRAHTFSSARIAGISVNGQPIPEAAFSAAIAGHFGVPVVMMAGDDAALAEARQFLGDIEYAETKKTLGFHAALTLTPEAARSILAQKTKAALRRLASIPPFRFREPLRMTITFKHYRPAEILSLLPFFQRLDSHTISFTAENILQASDCLLFITSYSFDLQP
ncbi:MAG: M55 family metallopeptidase [candidate division KSB1 bacterium]|nr:M55 family metallopeptidase [candidate division KSB1 bacterium]